MSDAAIDDRDERLAVVFDQMMQASKPGSPQKRLDDAVRLHPDLARDLRELFATTLIVDDIAMLQSTDLNHLTGGGSTFPRTSGSLAAGSAIGTMIGEYELRQEIGRGGMGVVYRAFQASLERTVALKMIPNAAFAAAQDLARLRAEALAAARLSHPNIVPVYEVGEHNGQPWFSMQFIEGTTLSQRLMSGPMKPREAAALLVPIVEAIGAAHRAGVLHRDLKPSNILIAVDGTPFVTDFGLAKRVNVEAESMASGSMGSDLTNLTQSGAILGTPAWMSPEQAAGQTDSIDVATDVYSLGAVLFAMLTGRPPFQAASPLDTVLMVIEQDPPNIRMLNRAVDSDLEMVVLKCLQKPQDLRYSSAGALAADLRAWLNSEPVSARSSTIAQVMTRLFRESHHAAILQNWGLLWMWHSLVVLLLCVITNLMQFRGVTERWPFVGLWVVGLGLWAAIFWNLRHRAGPITAVERQIAHIWGGSMIASSMLFWVESIMDQPVLAFSPVLGAIAGMVFLAKAGILSGSFYIQSILMFATALVMAAIEHSSLHSDFPNVSVSLFGVMSALTFFFPGLKYYRQQRRSMQ
ncbi:MAG: serine/threonine protein kinase [Planctomycetota bacterium]|jgi:serine/threonine-protein kinase|nr:serine/threonine-protein kinase [Planctomycetales bacterium]RLT09563.1 MAG: serine/threonine protein kinase [Planctomycetota bacterium]